MHSVCLNIFWLYINSMYTLSMYTYEENTAVTVVYIIYVL